MATRLSTPLFAPVYGLGRIQRAFVDGRRSSLEHVLTVTILDFLLFSNHLGRYMRQGYIRLRRRLSLKGVAVWTAGGCLGYQLMRQRVPERYNES